MNRLLFLYLAIWLASTCIFVYVDQLILAIAYAFVGIVGLTIFSPQSSDDDTFFKP